MTPIQFDVILLIALLLLALVIWFVGRRLHLTVAQCTFLAVLPILIGGIIRVVTASPVRPIPFYMIFIPGVVLFALFIYFVGTRLYEKVPQRTFLIGILILIGGIIGGVVMMFQPFVLEGFKIGFGLVFVSLFAFMVWSHVQPRTRPAIPATTAGETHAAAEAGGAPAGEG